MGTSDVGNFAIGTPAATTAPLMGRDIAQLEELFAISTGDVEALTALQDELRYRSSPRALALLNQIRNVLDAGAFRLRGASSRETDSGLRDCEPQALAH